MKALNLELRDSTDAFVEHDIKLLRISSSYVLMVSITDFTSLRVHSVTLSYHLWRFTLAVSFVRFLFLYMYLSELTRLHALKYELSLQHGDATEERESKNALISKSKVFYFSRSSFSFYLYLFLSTVGTAQAQRCRARRINHRTSYGCCHERSR